MLKDGARIEGVLLDISASEYVIQDGGGKRFVSKNLVVEIQRRIAKGFLVLQGKLVPPKGKRAGEEGGSQASTKPEPQYDDAPEELRSQP